MNDYEKIFRNENSRLKIKLEGVKKIYLETLMPIPPHGYLDRNGMPRNARKIFLITEVLCCEP